MTIYSSAEFNYDIALETAFNSKAVGTDLGTIGIGGSFSTYAVKNNFNPIYSIGKRTPDDFYSAGEAIDVSLDFVMCGDEKDWLQSILTYASGTPNQYSTGNTMSSLMASLETSGGNVWTVGGIGVKSAKVTVNEGDVVKTTLDGTGTSYASATGTVSPTTPTELYTWKDVSINGITTGLIKSLDFTIDTGMAMIYALGSLNYQAFLPLKSTLSGSIEAYHESGVIESIIGQTAGTSLVITIGNYTFTFADVWTDEGDLNLKPVEAVTDKINFYAQTLVVT